MYHPVILILTSFVFFSVIYPYVSPVPISTRHRDDIAELAVEALLNPEASGLTFEVKSDLAFSTLWEGAPDGDAGRNYG